MHKLCLVLVYKSKIVNVSFFFLNFLDNMSSESQGIFAVKSVFVQLSRSSPRYKHMPAPPPKRTSSFKENSYPDGLDTVEDDLFFKESPDMKFESGAEDYPGCNKTTEGDCHDRASEKEDSGVAASSSDASSVHLKKSKKNKSQNCLVPQKSKDNHNGKKNDTKKVKVAALEVQNVKKAISRYGTLPKGARIGAYLDSLRQHGLHEGTSCPPETVMEGELECLREISEEVHVDHRVTGSVTNLSRLEISSSRHLAGMRYGLENQSIRKSHRFFLRQKSDLTHNKMNDVLETFSITESHHLRARKPILSDRFFQNKKAEKKSESLTCIREPMELLGNVSNIFVNNTTHHASWENVVTNNCLSTSNLVFDSDRLDRDLHKRNLKKRTFNKPAINHAQVSKIESSKVLFSQNKALDCNNIGNNVKMRPTHFGRSQCNSKLAPVTDLSDENIFTESEESLSSLDEIDKIASVLPPDISSELELTSQSAVLGSEVVIPAPEAFQNVVGADEEECLAHLAKLSVENCDDEHGAMNTNNSKTTNNKTPKNSVKNSSVDNSIDGDDVKHERSKSDAFMNEKPSFIKRDLSDRRHSSGSVKTFKKLFEREFAIYDKVANNSDGNGSPDLPDEEAGNEEVRSHIKSKKSCNKGSFEKDCPDPYLTDNNVHEENDNLLFPPPPPPDELQFEDGSIKSPVSKVQGGNSPSFEQRNSKVDNKVASPLDTTTQNINQIESIRPENVESKLSIIEIYKSIEDIIGRLRNSSHSNGSKVNQLSEKINLLCSTCGNHTANLPAQEQFHFCELVSILEKQKENFHSYSSKCSSDVKLLTEIHSTIRDLINVVQR